MRSVMSTVEVDTKPREFSFMHSTQTRPEPGSPAKPTMGTQCPAAVHCPDFEAFRKLATDGKLVPVYRRLVCDSLTPVSAFHKIDSGRCACLFESVVGGEKVGRYSFLAADPFSRSRPTDSA